MPTYEYACRKCGQHLEVVQSFSDDPLTRCPACKGELRKVFGSIGIAFKGSGFYKTDSRKSTSSSKPPKEAAAASSGGSEGSSGSTSTAAPAASASKESSSSTGTSSSSAAAS